MEDQYNFRGVSLTYENDAVSYLYSIVLIGAYLCGLLLRHLFGVQFHLCSTDIPFFFEVSRIRHVDASVGYGKICVVDYLYV